MGVPSEESFSQQKSLNCPNINNATLIARLMGPTYGPSGADRTQVGPMLAPWTLISGKAFPNDYDVKLHTNSVNIMPIDTWATCPVGPRWAPCWPREPCYLGSSLFGASGQAMTRTNAHILLIEPIGTKFIAILIRLHPFSLKKMNCDKHPSIWCKGRRQAIIW